MRHFANVCASFLLLAGLRSAAHSNDLATAASNTEVGPSHGDDEWLVKRGDTQSSSGKNYIAYWSVWAKPQSTPTKEQLDGVTHLVLAFPDITQDVMTWPFFPYSGANVWTPDYIKNSVIQPVRAINSGIKIYAAVGGWGYENKFPQSTGAVDAFVTKISSLVDTYGLDGIDIDWEYPGGNGQYYKPTPLPNLNAVAVQLASSLKAKLNGKGLTWAMPGRPDDVKTYDSATIKSLSESVDFFNVMTYDYMNRRDSMTSFHAGGWVIGQILAQYTQLGMDIKKANIGFPMYAKWFAYNTSSCDASSASPINCSISGPYEDPKTGADLGISGTWVFDADVQSVTGSAALTTKMGLSDYFSTAPNTDSSDMQGSALLDTQKKVFWTWVSPDDVSGACQKYLSQVAGVMVWSINMDGPGSPRFQALAKCLGGSK